MENFLQLLAGRDLQLTTIMFALLAGVAVVAVIYGLTKPPQGRPVELKTLQHAEREMVRGAQRELVGIDAKLKKAHIEISATEYVRRSLMLGIPLGIGLYILIGAVVLFAVGILAGFTFVWTQLEQERDKKTALYSKQLAGACDTVRTAYGVNPSLKKAIAAAAEFTQSPLKEDFQEILIAIGQEQFVEGLQAVADRRSSIVFDGVATALIRAHEATGEVGDMLQRLAVSTRQNVSAFEEALSSQINARSNITWGTYGPWMIFAAFKIITFLVGMLLGGGNFFGGANNYFGTIQGNLLALFAAGISMGVNRFANSVAQRGLVVKRVSASEAAAPSRVLRGQSRMMDAGDAMAKRNVIHAQGRPN